MNYSLGNMLGGNNGSLNPDKLSLNLQFATDKTLTARKGPTPTFTRASTATFVGSDGLIQSAAINTARFDHDPVTLASKGLLIEESRTNLATYSEDLALAFTVERASVLSNNATSPDGATTADKLVEDTTATNSHRLTRQLNLSAIPYTFSVFAKASERSWIRMTLFDGVTSRQVWFDVSAGTIGTQSGATGQIASFGNGWWRCSITATGLAFVSSQVNIALATADNISAYTGDGTSGLFLWGAQLEAGSFPTSYIPTTTASVVRSADLCSITGASFTGFYNQSEGTYQGTYSFVSGYSNTGISMVLAQASNNTFNELTRIGTATSGSLQRLDTIVGGVLTRITTTNAQSLTSQNKVSGAYKVGENAISLNGSSVITGSPANITSLANRLDIGSIQDGTSKINGHIASLRYFKKRLPNAKLQTLTTL
jgi:hypothetical protein